jgi:hypothetical protein
MHFNSKMDLALEANVKICHVAFTPSQAVTGNIIFLLILAILALIILHSYTEEKRKELQGMC